MANDLNQCTFTGRLGKAPETLHTASGDDFVTMAVAVGSQWKNKATGEREEATEWVNVTIFGRLASICEKYLKKGSRVLIQGTMKTRSYENNGEKRYITGIVLDDFNGKMQMLDPRTEEPDMAPKSSKPRTAQKESTKTRKDSGYGVDPIFDDDVPF